MKKSERIRLIEKSIFETGNIFKKNKKIILNESDAQAFLFNYLRENLEIPDSIHCQCKVDEKNIRPDIMVLKDSNIKFETKKDDQYSIKKWSHDIFSVIEIKHLLKATSDKVYRKIRYDFNKLKNADIPDSYVVLFHHSSEKDKNLFEKLKKLTIKDKNLSLSIFYTNRKNSYLFKNGKIIK